MTCHLIISGWPDATFNERAGDLIRPRRADFEHAQRDGGKLIILGYIAAMSYLPSIRFNTFELIWMFGKSRARLQAMAEKYRAGVV